MCYKKDKKYTKIIHSRDSDRGKGSSVECDD